MNNPMSLEGRTIIVTGAAQGIGRAITDSIVGLGGKVAGIDLNEAGLKETAAAHGNRFLALTGSVADTNFVAAAVEQAVTHFGAVHGLVNNAGITRPAMIEKMSLAQWQQVIDVHMNGSFYLTQAVGRHWLERAKAGDTNPGSLVNISSDAGRRGTIGQINYATAKSAQFGMAMSVAREWARYGVRANVVCFGMVETQMTEKVRGDEKLTEIYLSQIPLGRWGKPAEVATPVCFLLSDAASYLTGQVISVNGGYTIAM